MYEDKMITTFSNKGKREIIKYLTLKMNKYQGLCSKKYGLDAMGEFDKAFIQWCKDHDIEDWWDFHSKCTKIVRHNIKWKTT